MKSQRTGRRVGFRFSIRGLLVFAAIVGLSIAAGEFLWSRRALQTVVFVPRVSVDLYTPYVDTVAAQSDTIADLRIDLRANALVITAQARNLDAATAEIRRLIEDENLIFAASSSGLTFDEMRQLQSSP